jgi:hypothetical protein
MSEIRAKLLSYLNQRSEIESEVQLESFLDQFSSLHRFQRRLVNEALFDLRSFGLVQTTPDAVALTSLARRLLP